MKSKKSIRKQTDSEVYYPSIYNNISTGRKYTDKKYMYVAYPIFEKDNYDTPKYYDYYLPNWGADNIRISRKKARDGANRYAGVRGTVKKIHVIPATPSQIRRARDKAEKKYSRRDWQNSLINYYSQNRDNVSHGDPDKFRGEVGELFHLIDRQTHESVITDLRRKARKRGKKFF